VLPEPTPVGGIRSFRCHNPSTAEAGAAFAPA
jgi:hypothetical protein